MGVRTTIGEKGVVFTPGDGVKIEKNALNAGFAPYSVVGQTAATANVTISNGEAGVYTVSGSTGTGVLTVAIPAASSNPMMMLVVRALSADAHVVTASAETAGTKAICTMSGTFGGTVSLTSVGSFSGRRAGRCVLGGSIGNSVMLMSDGVNWLVMAASGTLNISDGTS